MKVVHLETLLLGLNDEPLSISATIGTQQIEVVVLWETLEAEAMS